MDIQLELPANICICASTMGGKTHLTKRLINEQLLKQLDALVILSPTLDLSGDWNEYKEQHDLRYGKIIQKFSKKSEFPTIISEILEQNEGIIKNLGRSEAPNVVIVVDDCIGHSMLRPNRLLDNLSTRSRHLKVSLIVLSQKITAIPRIFRLNCRYFIMFQAVNFSEMERFIEELASKSIRRPLRDKINEIYNEPFNFILVQCFANKIRERMYLNGKTNIYDLINQDEGNQD